MTRGLGVVVLFALLSIPAGGAAQKGVKARKPVAKGQKAKTFPPRGYKKVEEKIDRSESTGLNSRKRVFHLGVERPADWEETVVTDAKGVVLVRGEEQQFDIPNMSVGVRYAVYFVREKKKQYFDYGKSFVKYSNRDFPGRAWKPAKKSALKLVGVKQFTPKTMFEAFDHPHRLIFKPAAGGVATRVYLMTRIEKGEKSERVVSQCIDGHLKFWGHAKKGGKFRVYELDPEKKTYRVSKPGTVEKDYPLGK